MIDAGDVALILLAAGQSSRFGDQDKLLADLNGQPLVLHAAQRVVELNPGRKIAVCGHEVGTLLKPSGFELMANPDARFGLSTSLALGIEAAARGQASAALICLGDMPFVSLGHLRALLAGFDAEQAPVVASRKNGTNSRGMPPAIFARTFFAQLQSGQGDQGARSLLSSASFVGASAEELTDIDSTEDMRRIKP